MGQVSKLNYVDGKLGAPTSGQQTTRVVWNTVVPSANTSQMTFFKNFQGLTPGQTNLTTNKLDSSESMVIKSIWFRTFIGNNNFPDDETFGTDRAVTVSIIVGNEKVVKDLPIHFNSGLSGQPFDRLHANSGQNVENPGFGSFLPYSRPYTQPTEVRLLTDIVIPPQVAFSVEVNFGILQDGNRAYVCALSGYGKIFSAGASF